MRRRDANETTPPPFYLYFYCQVFTIIKILISDYPHPRAMGNIFEVPGGESQFEDRILEVSTITYTTNDDINDVTNAVRIIMQGPLKVSDSSHLLEHYGMIVLRVNAVEDKCGVWLSKKDEKCDSKIVLFIFTSPVNKDAQSAEVQETLRKIKAIAKIK